MFTDSRTKRILLVRSKYHHTWGIPKGSIKYDESIADCALRKAEEETGIRVNREDLGRSYRVDYLTYYHVDTRAWDLNPIAKNDAVGITWLKIDCLLLMLAKGQIQLNKNAKLAIGRLLDARIH